MQLKMQVAVVADDGATPLTPETWFWFPTECPMDALLLHIQTHFALALPEILAKAEGEQP